MTVVPDLVRELANGLLNFGETARREVPCLLDHDFLKFLRPKTIERVPEIGEIVRFAGEEFGDVGMRELFILANRTEVFDVVRHESKMATTATLMLAKKLYEDGVIHAVALTVERRLTLNGPLRSLDLDLVRGLHDSGLLE